jgi:hypothetical protein
MSVRRSTLVVTAAVAVALFSAGTAEGTAQLLAHANGPGRWVAMSAPVKVGQFYEGSVGPHAPVLLAVGLGPLDLPAGAVVEVRTAEGPNENCTHAVGSGVDSFGHVATSDGWLCSRLPAKPAQVDCTTLSGALLMEVADGEIPLCPTVHAEFAGRGQLTPKSN